MKSAQECNLSAVVSDYHPEEGPSLWADRTVAEHEFPVGIIDWLTAPPEFDFNNRRGNGIPIIPTRFDCRLFQGGQNQFRGIWDRWVMNLGKAAHGSAFKQIARKRIPTLGLIGSLPADSRHIKEPVPLSDTEIIRRVLDGDTDLFEQILNRYKIRVFGIVGKHVPPDDVEEVAHDVFIRTFKSLPTYKHKSGFGHWLSAIAVRTSHDYWRSRYRSREVAVSNLSESHQKWLERTIATESSVNFSEETDREEAGEIVRWALCQLPEKDKIVLELIYFQDYTIKEAAALLGWKETTLKVRSFRSRRKLQAILRDAMKPDSSLYRIHPQKRV